MKQINVIAGLPRSGSTLLCNILAQNPRFHTTATSGVLEILFTARNRFWEVSSFKAMEEKELDAKIGGTLRGMLYGYYADIDRPVVFDKSRGWEGYFEMLANILQRQPKALIPVRDIRDVLASLEKLTRKTCTTRQHPDEKAFPFRTKTIQGRCELWLGNEGGIVGMPINMIRDAVVRGWRKSMHFVDYDRLTRKPKDVMKEVYEFLDEPVYEHDFNNVEQVTYENDLVHVFKDLHKIRQKVEPQEPQWPSVLPKALADQYAAEAKFWQEL